MVCKLSRPSQQDLFNRVRDMFSSTVLGGANVIPESNEWYAVSLNYAMAEEFYAVSEQAWRERDPRYACCENLVDMAEKDGVYPRPATAAQGYIKMTGVAGTILEQGLLFNFRDQVYMPASTLPGSMPVNGFLVLRVQAVIPGATGNMTGLIEGTIQDAPEGIDPTVTLYGERFCAGADAETCEQFRSRYLERLAYKTSYGIDWIKQKVLEWPCVSSVCVRDGSCCVITVDNYGKKVRCDEGVHLYALFDTTFPCGLAPECVTEEISEWIFGEVQGIGLGQAEWGMFGKIHTAEPGYVIIKADGIACATPSQQQEIIDRVEDFILRNCPSQTVKLRDISTIIQQVLGPGFDFGVYIEKPDWDDPKIEINDCGDAVPICDVKVCLQQPLIILGTGVVTSGVCTT